MSAVWRVVRAEWSRLVRLRSTWIVLLLLAAASALRASIALGATLSERGGAEDPLSSGKGWAPLVDGWRVGLVLGALVLLAAAARSIAGDRESGVLRLAVTRSVPRSALVLGRLLLAPAYVLAILLATGLAAFAVAWSTGDFGALVEDGYELLSAAELRQEVVRAVLAVLPALLATHALGLFIGCAVRGTTLAVTTALGLFLAFDLFKEGLGAARAWVFATHVPSLADSSAWAELAGVARGYSDAGLSDAHFRLGLVAPWPALVLLTVCACLWLARKAL